MSCRFTGLRVEMIRLYPCLALASTSHATVAVRYHVSPPYYNSFARPGVFRVINRIHMHIDHAPTQTRNNDSIR